MSFIAGTQIFTNTGWKNIEEISGKDKVLVRNFIGDAEFTQPFAIKKKFWDHEIVKIGGKNWSFSVTPDHVVVYDRDAVPRGSNFVYKPAEEVEIHPNNRIYRKFKYLASEEYKKESIIIHDEFGKRYVSVANHDWFTLMGYILTRGYFGSTKKGRYAINIRLDNDKIESELPLLADILDRIGVVWSVLPNRILNTHFIRINHKNSLASRIITRLGSDKRKEMYLSDNMIFNSTKELAHTLLETIITATKRADTERGTYYQFHTNNEKLVDSLTILCTLWGYGAYSTVTARKGENKGQGVLKKDVIMLTIANETKTYSPTKIERLHYEGNVYSIDLFDGQVYVREGKMPVWVNPK